MIKENGKDIQLYNNGMPIQQVNENINVTNTTNTDSSAKDFHYPRSIIQVLKNELIQLEGKIANARRLENWGTYKNLILAYKEVFMLIENTVKVHELTMGQINNLLSE